jgi:uncharacterized membrane protein YhaH (DUF805 family)
MVRFLLSAEGRASRAAVWRGLAPLHLVLCVAVALDVVYLPAPLPAASLAVGALLLWPTAAVAVKRFHDRGLSGWWMLWLLLAAAAGMAAVLMDIAPLTVWGGRLVAVGCGLIVFAIVYLSPGQDSANAFGAPPGQAETVSGPRPDLPRTDHFESELPRPLKVSLAMSVASAVAAPRPGRRPDRPCRPVPQTFKGMKAQVASLFEPAPLPPGARATFGRRGE